MSLGGCGMSNNLMLLFVLQYIYNSNISIIIWINQFEKRLFFFSAFIFYLCESEYSILFSFVLIGCFCFWHHGIDFQCNNLNNIWIYSRQPHNYNFFTFMCTNCTTMTIEELSIWSTGRVYRYIVNIECIITDMLQS